MVGGRDGSVGRSPPTCMIHFKVRSLLCGPPLSSSMTSSAPCAWTNEVRARSLAEAIRRIRQRGERGGGRGSPRLESTSFLVCRWMSLKSAITCGRVSEPQVAGVSHLWVPWVGRHPQNPSEQSLVLHCGACAELREENRPSRPATPARSIALAPCLN
jgi:hypothetical protein